MSTYSESVSNASTIHSSHLDFASMYSLILVCLFVLNLEKGIAFRASLRSSLVMKDYPQPNVANTVKDHSMPEFSLHNLNILCVLFESYHLLSVHIQLYISALVRFL